MKFVIAHDSDKGGYVWQLLKSDATVCRSSQAWPDEAAARSDVAAAKKAMSGAKFAKVEVIS